jgi:hypothetical protein
MKIQSLDGSLFVEHVVGHGVVDVIFSNNENPVLTLSVDQSDLSRLAKAIQLFEARGAARFELGSQALLIEGPEEPTNKRDPLFHSVQIRIIKTGIGSELVNGIFSESTIKRMLESLEAVEPLSA